MFVSNLGTWSAVDKLPRHPKFPAPDLCTLCVISSWVYDETSILWLDYQAVHFELIKREIFPGWTQLSEVSHLKESEASERHSPAGPEKPSWDAVGTMGAQNSGWLLGAEGLQSYVITMKWLLPVISEFGTGLGTWHGLAAPANALILAWGDPEQGAQLTHVWTPDLKTKINGLLHC